MSVGSIARRFEALGVVPIDISAVISAVNDILFDEYVCVHGVNASGREVNGICYQSKPKITEGSALRPMTEHRVIYDNNMPGPYQRLVVCKELIHILDPEPLRTRTKSAVNHLIEKMRLKEKPEDLESPNGLRVFLEKLAEYQAVAILFPFGYWEMIYPKYIDGKTTVEEIAGTLEIPPEYVAATMTEDWRYMREQVLLD